MADAPITALDPKARRRAARAIIIGSALEWYDFYLYASMAALVFGGVFFPSGDASAATLASFATFAVGFIARPFGGIVFGALGDRFGRKAVLSSTFLVMGVSSGCIGLLPSYASIGVAAPVLLVILRFAQGLGAGAEFGSAIAMSYEYAEPGRTGRLGSWPALGVNIGLFASSLTVTILSAVNEDFLYGWGWRLPFLFSFALAGVGYVVRRRLPETAAFERLEESQPHERRRPLLELIAGYWKPLLVVMVMTIAYNGASYVFKTYSLTYLKSIVGVPASYGTFGITLASLAAIITVPLVGRLCDRIDSRRILLVCGVGIAALAFPFFAVLGTGSKFAIWGMLILATGVVIPAALSAQGDFLARQFPVQVRNSGLGTGREVGGAFAGGLAPLAAVAMVSSSPTHSTLGVSLMFVAAGVLMLGAAAFDRSRRTRVAPATGASQKVAG
ncbi:MFS transporter [Nocardioides sp. NPDC057577]|uniref:MFS transporter n=1 Tax=Nocardioides sp. NPDC057577 TaxID=3346171 RepID=UPI00366DB5B5